MFTPYLYLYLALFYCVHVCIFIVNYLVLGFIFFLLSNLPLVWPVGALPLTLIFVVLFSPVSCKTLRFAICFDSFFF